MGTYVGVIPGAIPMPDPLNGIIKFKLLSININGLGLLSESKINGLTGWYNSLCKQIHLSSILNINGENKIILSNPSLAFNKIHISKIDVQNIKEV
jgi:hypothetical protein